MHRLAAGDMAAPAPARGGFIHLPWLPGQGTPSLPLERVVEGLALAIACALATRQDLRREGGAIS